MLTVKFSPRDFHRERTQVYTDNVTRFFFHHPHKRKKWVWLARLAKLWLYQFITFEKNSRIKFLRLSKKSWNPQKSEPSKFSGISGNQSCTLCSCYMYCHIVCICYHFKNNLKFHHLKCQPFIMYKPPKDFIATILFIIILGNNLLLLTKPFFVKKLQR